MKENAADLKSNLTKVDSHNIGHGDYADIPELPENFFSEGQLYRDGQPVKRRTRGKQNEPTKKQLTLRLNLEVVDFFKAQGKGWQASINKALLEYIEEHRHA